MMDMLPGLSPSNYSTQASAIATATHEYAQENMLAACQYLHTLQDVEPTELIDISVTCDGIWSKRRFTASSGSHKLGDRAGFGLRDPLETLQCLYAAEDQVGSEQFIAWMQSHKDHC